MFLWIVPPTRSEPRYILGIFPEVTNLVLAAKLRFLFADNHQVDPTKHSRFRQRTNVANNYRPKEE